MSLCLLSDLRVFPERYVVCVSCPEDALAHHRNPSLPAVSAVYTHLFPLPVAWQKSSMGLCVIIGMCCQIVLSLIYVDPLYMGVGSEPTGALFFKHDLWSNSQKNYVLCLLLNCFPSLRWKTS